MVRDWRLALLGVYVLACTTTLLGGGFAYDLDSLAAGMLALALLTAPIVPLCIWRGQAMVKGVATIVIGGVGLFLVVDTLYLQPPDAQGALVFLFVPVLQILAVAAFAIALTVFSALSRRVE
ncbi:hypothetical protein [Erythrobacter sp. CCH5-A1]|jgi:hypothetical protein|uniref:hypothetical protein n=1 Tax=Erythrobacter sp. CCH5-A1 TaxID=1768792 RepID=UPI00082E3E76|nr:hypothetical protein [Erythrobacter sp. CCH5-A1]